MTVTETYTVSGMTCEHCVQGITGELTRLPGIRDVRVDLPTGAVTLRSDGQVPFDEVRAAVEEAGFALA
jgi:copper chaperone CopZ